LGIELHFGLLLPALVQKRIACDFRVLGVENDVVDQGFGVFTVCVVRRVHAFVLLDEAAVF